MSTSTKALVQQFHTVQQQWHTLHTASTVQLQQLCNTLILLQHCSTGQWASISAADKAPIQFTTSQALLYTANALLTTLEGVLAAYDDHYQQLATTLQTLQSTVSTSTTLQPLLAAYSSQLTLVVEVVDDLRTSVQYFEQKAELGEGPLEVTESLHVQASNRASSARPLSQSALELLLLAWQSQPYLCTADFKAAEKQLELL